MDKELLNIYNLVSENNASVKAMGAYKFYEKVSTSDESYNYLVGWLKENGMDAAPVENFKKKSTETPAPKSTPAPSGSTPSSLGGVETPKPEPESVPEPTPIPEPKRESFLPKEFAPSVPKKDQSSL